MSVIEKYDTRHGGPFDRGMADSYYNRERNPHYYKGNTYDSDRVHTDEMTEQEIEAYNAGFDYNEELGDRKDW